MQSSKTIKRNALIRTMYSWGSRLLFEPTAIIRSWRALPYFLCNLIQWGRLNRNPRFRFRWKDSFFTSADRFENAGSAHGHYFWQDLWAAEELISQGVEVHVDIGSRLDGFIAHVLPTCIVTYVDLRPLQLEHKNFVFLRGSILELPFASDSVASLSCLHVIEHIGLGRYGDPVDPEAHIRSADELARVLAPGGRLLLGTPVGVERLCFDAHRVFDPETVASAFGALQLTEFHLVPDESTKIVRNATFAEARACHYGCGLFVFSKSD